MGIRKTLKNILFGTALSAASIIPGHAYAAKHREYSKIPVPKVGYSQIVKEQNFSKVKLANDNTDIGRMQRARRWRNVTRAVETAYDIPENYLLGMACVESEGNPVQPNSLGDGGVGLIHQQPLMASKYGLEMITDSKRLRDFYQGKKINKAIDTYNGDLKDLIKMDDRFHPIKNVDAAGRMLRDSYEHKKSWSKALEAYAGRRTYDDKVIRYAKLANNQKFMNEVCKDFEKRNPNLGMDYTSYVSQFQKQNMNYGLEKYKSCKYNKVKNGGNKNGKNYHRNKS